MSEPPARIGRPGARFQALYDAYLFESLGVEGDIQDPGGPYAHIYPFEQALLA